MTWGDAYMYLMVIAVYLLMALGVVGTLLPVIPGMFVASLSILAFKLLFPESSLGWGFVIFAQCLSVAGQLADIFMTWIGAKKFGATWRGALGSFAGVVFGIFIPPQLFWIFAAPILFAFAFEYFGGASFKSAGRAGLGAFAGSVGASAFKIAGVFVMIGGFTYQMFF